MKPFIVCSISLLLGFSGTAQEDSIVVSGELKGLNGRKFNIGWTDNNDKSQGCSVIPDGDRFSVKIAAHAQPVVARLHPPVSAESRNSRFISPVVFFLYNKDIRMEGDPFEEASVTVLGDVENNRYDQLLQQTAPAEKGFTNAMQKLYSDKQKLSQADSIQYRKDSETYSAALFKMKDEFMKKNPDAFATLYLMYTSTYYYGADEYMALWEGLDAKYKQTTMGKSIQETVTKLSHTKAGTTAFDFERTDLAGNKISPATMKGKVYLLDFWGSWCGPCRFSHHHLKEIYKKYKPAGFEIVAVAQERGKTLDACKETWQKAIKEDGIDWVHVLNQDGIDKQDIVKTYKISGFPTKILIGADGKIIARISASVSDAIDKALVKIYGY